MELPGAARGANSQLRRASSSSSSRRRRRRRIARTWSAALLTLTLVLAPLAAGGVHRPTVLILSLMVLVAFAFLALGEWRTGSSIRLSAAIAFPAAFVLLTALQLLPLPPAVADRLDPRAGSLLADGGGGTGGWRPLTMDPPLTQQVLARSAIAFLLFVAVYHLAARKDGRSWILRAVAATGVTAVVIGLGHRIFAIPKIYGLFTNTRYSSLLVGPFINSNHSAELLELATFVGIACARQAGTPIARIGWLGGAVICAAGSLATMSRASVFALGVGAAVMVVGNLLGRPIGTPSPGRRRGLLVFVLGLAGVVVVAASIGAVQLLDRFQGASLGKDVRFQVWRDSLNVLRAHPLGIGRQAFDTVYPIYQTLVTPNPVRFSFVENHPLQLLIDFGLPGFLLLVATAIIPVRELIRNGRRDRVELAMLAGLLAVGAHSLTDFGLETFGVLLPFVAVLATLLGRTYRSPWDQTAVPVAPRPTSQRAVPGSSPFPWSSPYTVPVAIGFGVGLVAFLNLTRTSAGRDFDDELKLAADAQARRAVISAARRAHPFDHYFPLVLSTVEPLTVPGERHSPRLRALNQALVLCQNCPDVHVQIARTMWRLGRRSQALAEWAAAARSQTSFFEQALRELTGLGARPDELARIAEENPQRLLDLARFVLGTAHPEQAEPIIAAAARAGALPLEVVLLEARMKLLAPDLPAAEQAVARAKSLGPADSRVALLDAENVMRRPDPDAGAQALRIVERGLDRDPNNLDLQRKRIEIIRRFERWSAADRSIAGFKQALQASDRSTVEANLAAAGIYLSLGRIREALAEYAIATTSNPEDPNVWRQFASTAEATKHYVLAREAYAEVMRLAPDNQTRDAMRRLDDLQATDRLRTNPRVGGLELR